MASRQTVPSEPPLDPAGIELTPYEQVAEMRDFVLGLGKGRSMVGTMVARFDIDDPQDNRKEYILRVGVANFCEGDVCEYKIVRLNADGRLTEVFSSGVGTLRFATTSSNGHRDIVTENPYGRYLWKYDGHYYQSTELVRTRAGQATVASKPRIPGCVGEYGWRSGFERGRRSARGFSVFGSCTDPINMVLQLSCGDGESGVRVQLDANPDQTGPLAVTFTIDGQTFERSGEARFSELAGSHLPELLLKVGDPLLRALARGKTATVTAGKARVDVHLKGASKAIGTMRRACRS